MIDKIPVEELVPPKAGYWGKAPEGVGMLRDAWACKLCGSPAMIIKRPTGNVFPACPTHGELHMAPGMDVATLDAVLGFMEQLHGMTAAQVDNIRAMKKMAEE